MTSERFRKKTNKIQSYFNIYIFQYLQIEITKSTNSKKREKENRFDLGNLFKLVSV